MSPVKSRWCPRPDLVLEHRVCPGRPEGRSCRYPNQTPWPCKSPFFSPDGRLFLTVHSNDMTVLRRPLSSLNRIIPIGEAPASDTPRICDPLPPLAESSRTRERTDLPFVGARGERRHSPPTMSRWHSELLLADHSWDNRTGSKPVGITMPAREGRSLASSALAGSSGLDIPQSLAPIKKTERQ